VKRLLLTGYFGYGNSGDEATLAVLLQRLPQVLGDAEITVLSHQPEETGNRWGIPAVQRMDFLAVRREIRRCDGLIFGGGSLLQNATSNRSLLYYLAQFWTAKRLGKPVILLSQGIGPLNGHWAKRAVARAVNTADGITLRDELSRETLIDLGVPAERLTVTGDLTLLWEEKPIPGDCTRENRVGILPGPGCGERQREELRRIVGWLQKQGKQVVLIPLFPQQDLALCQELSRDCHGAVVAEVGDVQTQRELIRSLDCVVSVRLHGLVYGASLGVPLVGISYDPKVEGFLRQMGCWDGLTVENLTLERFQTAYARATEDRNRKTQTESRVQRAKLALKQQESWLKEWAESGGKNV
jgi:polysaccharide pyruvyl transferase CsaB